MCNSPPINDPLDQLLEGLPAAYAAWEQTASSPELSRIEKRVTRFLTKASATPPTSEKFRLQHKSEYKQPAKGAPDPPSINGFLADQAAD